jgi:hypothetical protein
MKSPIVQSSCSALRQNSRVLRTVDSGTAGAAVEAVDTCSYYIVHVEVLQLHDTNIVACRRIIAA